jgi:hypothetical protein
MSTNNHDRPWRLLVAIATDDTAEAPSRQRTYVSDGIQSDPFDPSSLHCSLIVSFRSAL